MRTLLTNAVASAALSILAAGAACHEYWGYWWVRPDVPREIRNAAALRAVTPIGPTSWGRGCGLMHDRTGWVDDMDFSRRDEYGLPWRLVIALHDRGLAPERAVPDRGLNLAAVSAAVRSSAALVRATDEYPAAECLGGFAVDVEDEHGRSSLVLGVHSHQVANDHYAYYEMVLSRTASGWRVESTQRLFYDVAGVEGLEWPIVARAFCAPILLVTSLLRRTCRRRRVRAHVVAS